MPQANLSDIEKKRVALENSLDELDKAFKKLDTVFGKRVMEMNTIYSGLKEGIKEIEDQEKELKELEKKVKAQEKQIQESRATWQKMLEKLKQTKSEVSTSGTQATNLMKEVDGINSDADGLMKDLTRAGGDVADIKAENAALKTVKRTADRLWTDFNRVKQDATSIPDDPKL